MASAKHKEKKVLLIVAIAFLVLVVFGIFFTIILTVFSGGEFNQFEKKLAVIPIKQPIFMSGSEFGGNFGALEIVEKIELAANDPNIAAIFFDIDSPGGEPVATHQIVEKIREVEKPTISYIGSTGTSAAYWIAASTDYIVADPFSVTASIGAISIFPNIGQFLEDNGIEVTIIKSGKLKASPNFFEEVDDDQKKLIKGFVDEAFKQFKADVLFFREGKIDAFEFEELTDGRIISGSRALELNLVDELLTREKAILKAGEIAGIKGKPALKVFGPKQVSFFELLTASGKAFANGFKSSFDLSNSFSIRT